MLVYVYQQESEPGYYTTEISLTEPDTPYNVAWANHVYYDGGLTYEDLADTLVFEPKLFYNHHIIKYNEPYFLKHNDTYFCICFWFSEATLDFLIQISTLIEGGCYTDVDDYDDAPVESANNFDELRQLIDYALGV